MDETPAYFDIVASKSIDKVGVKQCVIRSTGAEKRHLTVVLTVTADGNMLPPLIIFKGCPTGKIIEMELLEGMVAVRQEKGWMDTKVMHVYLEKIWYPYVLKVGGEAVKSLLVWDSFSAHLTAEVEESLRTHRSTTIIIPGGCTSKLQPLDVSINKPFKQVLRSNWGDYIKARSLSLTPAQLKDPKMKIKTAKREDVGRWVARGYLHLKLQTDLIRKSFAVTGISGSQISNAILQEAKNKATKALEAEFGALEE